MAIIRPFAAIRPSKGNEKDIAALPYDVYNSKEAREITDINKKSFLCIDRPETFFDEKQDMYAPEVYQKAHDEFWSQVANGLYEKELKPCFYLYELTMNGRSQTGFVGCASIDDYVNQVILKHENTREEKEIDRINHISYLEAQTGPIFLAYRDNAELSLIMDNQKKKDCIYDFVSDDGIGHRVWIIEDESEIAAIEKAFEKENNLYIADGHHRCASAVKVGLKKREVALKSNADNSLVLESDYFMSVIFPDSQLKILDYNRVLKDLNGLDKAGFFDKVCEAGFTIEESNIPVSPDKKGTFGMFIEDKWYKLTYNLDAGNDPVKSLDVSILQDKVLSPILNIQDPRIDKRIDFVGGIRGLGELEKRVNNDCVLAFSMYPTSIDELFAVADEHLLMPPKSTWFEPKLRSGLFIHDIRA